MFIEALDIEDVIAQLLVTEGFAEVRDVAYVPQEELERIEGFDEALAEELQHRARTWLDARDEEFEAKRRELGVEDTVAVAEGLTPEMLVRLGEAGVKTLDDLADLTADELRFVMLEERGEHTIDDLAQMDTAVVAKLLSTSWLEPENAEAIIMVARDHWFEADGQVAAAALAAEQDQLEAEAPAGE